MIGGFMFDGVDIAELGLEYAPDNRNTYVYDVAEYSVHEQSFDGHNGGFYYGTTTKPKVITLRCYYQDKKINDGIIAQTNALFSRGRTGKLVFKKRQWCWYNATVVNVDISNMFNYMNGIITITMKAYFPFARSDMFYIEDEYEEKQEALANSAFMVGSQWNYNPSVITSSNLTDAKDIVLFNPGTERSKVCIEIAGDVGDGVTIANNTTGQMCKFVAITKANTSNVNKYVISDAMSGKTIITNGIVADNGFMYHDSGFIELEPAFPIKRDISCVFSGTSVTTTGDKFTSGMIGKYICSNDKALIAKVVNVVNSNQLTIDKSYTGTKTASIMKANELRVSPVSSMELTKLDIIFKPTFA